jgi:hypothetical protein
MNYVGKSLDEIPFDLIKPGMNLAAYANVDWTCTVVEAVPVFLEKGNPLRHHKSKVLACGAGQNITIYDYHYKDFQIVSMPTPSVLSLSSEQLKQTSLEQQLRYALHSLKKIAQGQEDPARYAQLAINHITCKNGGKVESGFIFLNQSEAEKAYKELGTEALHLTNMVRTYLTNKINR